MGRLRLATVWLGGCSGCHMSLLDLDEWLIELSRLADVVYTPLADVKEYPDGVDVVLVEGAVANENPLGSALPVLERAYLELADHHPGIPREPGTLPRLLERGLPVHEVVDVDVFLPGCPPPAERIRAALEALLAGRKPELQGRAIVFG
jgi:NAD-reducing hydrogenase small subunit